MNAVDTRRSDNPYRLTHRLSTFSVDNFSLEKGFILFSGAISQDNQGHYIAP